MYIPVTLAIETSCDDTSVALVDNIGFVYFQKNASADFIHQKFGGIVPEIASRNHTLFLLPLVDEAIRISKSNSPALEIKKIAVTSRPGLVGALMVGWTVAKTLAWTMKLDFQTVNHLHGHIVAPFLSDKDYCSNFDFNTPHLSLVVSGGHTSIYKIEPHKIPLVLGKTRDDAAGEAFDKLSKVLGLGFPGGPIIDKMAQKFLNEKITPASELKGNVWSNPQFLPKVYRPKIENGEEGSLDFSFSGIKSQAVRLVEGLIKNKVSINSQTNSLSALNENLGLDDLIPEICFTFQEAVVKQLMQKLEQAMVKTNLNHFTITGGVSANSKLRFEAEKLAQKKSYFYSIAPNRYCTDNAAMIGFAATQYGDIISSKPCSASSLPEDFKVNL